MQDFSGSPNLPELSHTYLVSVVCLALCGIFTQELTAIGDELKKQIENERNEIERLTVSTVQPLLMAIAVTF